MLQLISTILSLILSLVTHRGSQGENTSDSLKKNCKRERGPPEVWVISVSTSNEFINMKMIIKRITGCEAVIIPLDASVAALADLKHSFSLLESEKDADTASAEAKTMAQEEKRNLE